MEILLYLIKRIPTMQYAQNIHDLINCFETPTVNLYLELSVVIYFMGFKVPTSSDKLSWALMSPIWVLPSLIYLIEPYLTLIWLYRTLFGPCYI